MTFGRELLREVSLLERGAPLALLVRAGIRSTHPVLADWLGADGLEQVVTSPRGRLPAA